MSMMNLCIDTIAVIIDLIDIVKFRLLTISDYLLERL